MKVFQITLLVCTLFFSFTSCKEDENEKLIVEMEKKNAIAFNKINDAWKITFPPVSQEVQFEISKWKQWNVFEQDLKQKPKTSISAFKLKVESLAKKSDSLDLTVPTRFNKPQVRSRIIAMKTKIQALDTYFSLDIIPQDKVDVLIKEINKELIAFYSQCQELVVKSKIPFEVGEKEMISALDTTRNAKNMDFDELEKLELEDKK